MPSYIDKTFCSSPNCKNKCGRKMTIEEANKYIDLGIRLSWHSFCTPKTVEEMILNDFWECAPWNPLFNPKSIEDIIKQDLEKLALYLSEHWQNTKDRKNNN